MKRKYLLLRNCAFMKNNDRAVFGTTYFFVGMEAQKIEISAQGHRRYIDISITSYK